MKPHPRLLQTLLSIGLSITLIGCSGTKQLAQPTSTAATTTADCGFEVGPGVVTGAVSQASGGIGGWVWHSVQPLGCLQWYPVVNLSSSEVAVTYDECLDDCVADGISISIDTFEMELHGRFVLRSDVGTENVDGGEGLVFVADGVTHAPDADRSMVSDIADTRWIFATQVTRTVEGFVVGVTGTGLNLELTAEQSADLVQLADGGTSEVLRVYGTTNGEGSITVEAIEFF
jgi:hypothetical protein